MKIKIRSIRDDKNFFVCDEFTDLRFLDCNIHWSDSVLGVYTITLDNNFFVTKNKISKYFRIINSNHRKLFSESDIYNYSDITQHKF